MARKGGVLEHPSTGERIKFIRTRDDTDGELLGLEVWAKPRDVVAVDHIHPKQIERIVIISGTCCYRKDGIEYEAVQGMMVEIPTNTPHVWWNGGKDELHLAVELQPALKTEELLETFCGLGQDGRTNPKTGRPNFFQMAVTLHEFKDELQFTEPTHLVPGAVFEALATVAWLLGYLPRCPYVYDTMEQTQICRYILDNGKRCNRAANEGQRFCPEHATRFGEDLGANDLEVYKVVTDKFNNELSMFWTRANLYLLVQAGLLSVAATLFKHSMSTLDTLIVFGMVLVGLSLGILWLLVMRGSIYWIGEWRKQVVRLDKAVDRFGALAALESRQTRGIWRPANVTKYLPVVFSVAWLLLAASILLKLVG